MKLAIYCRVSTRSQEQLDSLANQISYYTRLVAGKVGWQLVDIYVDIKSGSNITGRNEFQRMIYDCENGKIDLIITKSVSRFGRNSATTLQALNTLRNQNVDVYFESEKLNTKDEHSTLIISMLECIAQAESSNRSNNTSWGILRKIENGNAQLLRRKCYGYFPDEHGKLQIQIEEAQNIKFIFDMYLSGASILGIINELEKRKVISPTGKTKWCKRTIDTILSNEKYTGNVIACKTYNEGFPDTKRHINKGEREKYMSIGCNPAIISEELFKNVQEEKIKRSNVIKIETGALRKSTHYSSKRNENN